MTENWQNVVFSNSSGIENIKLFLFTADDQEELRKMALAAGVDKVVVKSPDAGEIVEMVSHYL